LVVGIGDRVGNSDGTYVGNYVGKCAGERVAVAEQNCRPPPANNCLLHDSTASFAIRLPYQRQRAGLAGSSKMVSLLLRQKVILVLSTVVAFLQQ
jgi:hypothetical protein